MTGPAHSVSATVRRHASAFVRTWPTTETTAPERHPDPEVRSTRVELDDLELAKRLLTDAPGPVLSAVRGAATGHWSWTVHYACGRALGRPEIASESLVLRTRRQKAYPWSHDRTVAIWRRNGGAGTWGFDAAWRWSTYAGESTPVERLSAAELGWWLKTGATATSNPRPAKKRTRNGSTSVLADTH